MSRIQHKPSLSNNFLIFPGSYKEYDISIDGDTLSYKANWGADTYHGLNHGSILFFGFDDLKRVMVSSKTPYTVPDIVDVDGKSTIIPKSKILDNDKDFRNSKLDIHSVQQPYGCTVELDENGDIKFTEAAKTNGTTSFKYTVKNALGFINANPTDVFIRHSQELNDPEYFEQWYLNEMRVQTPWNDYKGDGVKIAMFDENYIPNNPDINITQSTHQTAFNGRALGQHGLMVASTIIAKHNNEFGMVGIAPNSSLDSLQYPLSTNTNFDTKIYSAIKNYDIINNSWGSSYNYDCSPRNETKTLDISKESDLADSIQMREIIEDASINGRDGKGSIIVFAGGNTIHSDGNYEFMRVSPYINFIGGYNKPLEKLSSFEPYIPHFASLSALNLVAAPSSHFIVANNKNIEVYGEQLTSTPHNPKVAGTSFASPATAATIALMLEANPNLGWRDVQDILAYSALPKDFEGKINSKFYHENGAKNSNGGGLLYNKIFGFGVVDTHGAVRLAEVWEAQNAFHNYLNLFQSPRTFRLDNYNKAFTSTFKQNNAIEIEFVLLKAGIKLAPGHDNNFDTLSIDITSPSNTTYNILNAPGKNPLSNNQCLSIDSSIDWEFGIQHIRGDYGQGNWQVILHTAENGSNFKVTHLGLDFYGKPKDFFNTELIYTDAYEYIVNENRTLVDNSNGIFDTINTAAMTKGVFVSFNSDMKLGAGSEAIAIPHTKGIKNIKAGDGDDILIGNSESNIIIPGRGNDVILTGTGADVIYYPNIKLSNIGHDEILDFDINHDKLKIGNSDYSSLVSKILTLNPDNIKFFDQEYNEVCYENDTVIDGGNWSITLYGVDSTMITENIFDFS